jgi:hypothetical protein
MYEMVRMGLEISKIVEYKILVGLTSATNCSRIKCTIDGENKVKIWEEKVGKVKLTFSWHQNIFKIRYIIQVPKYEISFFSLIFAIRQSLRDINNRLIDFYEYLT